MLRERYYRYEDGEYEEPIFANYYKYSNDEIEMKFIRKGEPFPENVITSSVSSIYQDEDGNEFTFDLGVDVSLIKKTVE